MQVVVQQVVASHAGLGGCRLQQWGRGGTGLHLRLE